MTIVDAFSKWVEVFPCTHPDVMAMAKALVKDIIPRFGLPEKIYSDSGPHFVNHVIGHIGRVLNIEIKNHCACHPQSAGLVERTNGTIKSKLRKTMAETGRNWLYCLPLVTLNMHVVTTPEGLSPFEILYGRPYTIPEFIPFSRDEEEADQNMADYMNRQLACKELSTSLIHRSEATGAKAELKPGDWVFIKLIKGKTRADPR